MVQFGGTPKCICVGQINIFSVGIPVARVTSDSISEVRSMHGIASFD